MSVSFLDVFDQFRFMLGAIACEWLFVIKAVSKRSHFGLRAVTGLAVCALISLTIFPLGSVLAKFPVADSVMEALWWFFASFVSIGYIVFCFSGSVCNILFRGVLGLMLQQVVTVILRFCFVGMLFPTFPGEHTTAYVLITLLLYAVFCAATYNLIAKRMQQKNVVMESKKILWSTLAIIAVFSFVTDLSGGLFDWVKNIAQFPWETEYLTTMAVPVYCIIVLLALCVTTFFILYIGYEMAYLHQEKELIERLQREKEKQYIWSRENIELINQKCHDLKHQIQALRVAGEPERNRLFEEADRAVQFYDAVAETNNEVLDTILTEKSLICTNYKIRFSYNIGVRNLDYITVVDLYTMLGNALDNAIECVEGYDDEEKRVISLIIREKGQMLNLIVDNYFEGELQMKNGYPVTHKEDKANHGFGLRSIRTLAEKYHGDIRISHQNRTFSLHIMLPIPEK